MRFRFDHFVKKLLRKLLSGLGHVETEVEVAIDAQRIDLLFTPGQPAAPLRSDLGLLGRIVASSCILEAFRAPPTSDEIRGCIRKLLNWHHLQVLRARRRTRALPGNRSRGAPATPRLPVLWILSSGRPAGAVEGFALHPMEGWPTGVHAIAQEAIPVRLVVISELPRTRDTLVLRLLLGRGATLTHAARDLAALPRDSPERRSIAPFLVSLDRKLAQVQSKSRLTKEEKELLVDGQKLIDAIENRGWKRGRKQGLERGRKQGLQRGIEQGRAAGLEPLIHLFTRRLGRPLTEGERAAIVRRLGTLGPDRLGDVVLDLEAASLAAWLADPDAR